MQQIWLDQLEEEWEPEPKSGSESFNLSFLSNIKNTLQGINFIYKYKKYHIKKGLMRG